MKWLLTVLAVAFLGVGVWVLTLDADDPPISYRVLTVELGDPAKVVVTFEVDKDPSATAECQVTAVGEKRDVVNRLSGIRIPPAAQRKTVHKVTVPTDQRATSASVATCVVTGKAANTRPAAPLPVLASRVTTTSFNVPRGAAA